VCGVFPRIAFFIIGVTNMPDRIPPELEQKFLDCKEKVMQDGISEDSAYGICYAAVVDGNGEAMRHAAKYGFLLTPSDVDQIQTVKMSLAGMAVKAVGDWELDVLVIPFGSKSQADADGQWFEADTEIMSDAFSTPLVIYQHGIKQGGKTLSDRPLIIGKSIPGSLVKRQDGWHIRALLDKAVSVAKGVMEAAKNRAVAVSSDSIAHLARLDIGGKLIHYEKNRPGKIAVWPLAGFSLWEMGGGNFQPANRQAIALPAMKAMYREAGMVFPESVVEGSGTTGDLAQGQKPAPGRAKVEQIRQKAIKYLSKPQK
jgi:hypothetical protein